MTYRAPEQDRPPIRVLLAEDDPVNQTLAVCLLEKLGCVVDLAENGRKAVDMLRQASYDIVFMDCQMPEMNGFEATAEIRRLDSDHDALPIVALTASARRGTPEACVEAGMSGYIPKPVRLESLAAALAEWIATPRAPGIGPL